MPEEQIASETQSNEPQVEEFPTLQKKKSKKWLWVLIALIALVLIGVGIWLITKKPPTQPSNEPTDQATAAAKPKPKEEAKNPRTKVAYYTWKASIFDADIWVLDVVTKRNLRITNDGGGEAYNIDPVFTDEDSFTHLKCLPFNKCELWKVDLTDNNFTTEQIKKFSTSIRTYDIDSDLKTLVYLEDPSESEVNMLHLLNLSSSKDKIIHQATTYGRGGDQNAAWYTKISPDGSKVLFVDTGKPTEAQITMWDTKGNKLASLSGYITEPVWGADSKSIIYRDVKKGLFTYNLSNKTSENLSSEIDWSSVRISPNGQKLVYNKGFHWNENSCDTSNSKVYLFDLQTKVDKQVGEFLAEGNWVNNSYVITRKLKKTEPPDYCTGVEHFYQNQNVLVVVNINSNEFYEIQTEGIPTVFSQ